HFPYLTTGRREREPRRRKRTLPFAATSASTTTPTSYSKSWLAKFSGTWTAPLVRTAVATRWCLSTNRRSKTSHGTSAPRRRQSSTHTPSPDPDALASRTLLNSGQECAFLGGNLSMIYEARPKTCRTFP